MDAARFDVTHDEREAGGLTAEKLREIKHSFETIGFAVVGGLISAETCELLAQTIVEDVAAIRTRDERTQHEQRTGHGHLQLGLRRYAPFVRSELVANPLIESIIATLLGEGAWLGFYNGNVNTPGSGFQPLHLDRPFSWKSEEAAAAAGQPWPPPTTTISCSVGLIEITEENGATEIYPGTQRETAVLQWQPGERPENYPDLMEKWGPPSRMTIPHGGICFRDPRMWHRGVSNQSKTIRPMIGLTYHSPLAKHWKGLLVPELSEEDKRRRAENPGLRMMDDGSLGDARLAFDASARDAFESTENKHGVYRNVRFVEAPYTVNHFVDAHLLGGARVVKEGEITPYPEE